VEIEVMSAVGPRSNTPVLTIALIALSVLATIPVLTGQFGVVIPLLFATPGSPPFAEILSGQVWRLITPIFVHGNALHILFNMMWLWDLGRSLEFLKGRAFLGIFVLVSGIISNAAQALLGENSGIGMSGVVYALLAYAWIQGRYNPRFGMALHQSTVIMMAVWYVLCWTGLLGPIANWAHTAGIVIGMVWGFLDRSPSRGARYPL
jgi:membrane associated rhomboid family serine protease